MPTKVRTFAAPRPLGETLASAAVSPVSSQSAAAAAAADSVPRSLPECPSTISTPVKTLTTKTTAKTTTTAIAPSRDARKNGISMASTPQPEPEQKSAKGGVTYAYQDKLPKLPIPDLEQTCQRYLAALKPLQSPREHADTKRAVQEFLRNEGPELNERLKKYAEGKTSYIEQFWYDSYLNFDNPVVLNLNPFFLLEDDPTPARNNQVTRAASLIVSALEFVRAVRKEELPPDTVKGTPLCMHQYSRLFGTARVPTDQGCQIEQDPESKHIVVMCHGQFYWFDVLDDNSDLIMTEKDIAINLQTIIDDASQIPIQEAAKSALGVLSTENRKVWSGLREVLTREPGSNNADCLGIVDTALFVVCLDYTEPATAAELCQNMLCGTSQIEKGVQIGTCTNRWYDKLQIIVCKNGSAGINFEHTGVDGHTVLRFASDVYTDTILRFARTINGKAPTLWASTSPDPSKRDPESFGDVKTIPHKLEWDLIPELRVAVRFAETRLADLIEQHEFQCLDFSAYGKNFITSMGFSPDAFVQMAFQAAYYGLYGRVECTYEPAMTKMYLHGRTEAIRTVSEESVQFVQTFWGEHPAEVKIEALRRACARHVATTRECAKAQGCDRHLYALFCLWQRLAEEEAAAEEGLSSVGGHSSPRDGMSEGGDSIVGSPGAHGDEPSYLLDGEYTSSSTTTATSSSRQRNGGLTSPTLSSSTNRPRNDSITSSISSRSNRREYRPMPAIFADPGWDKLNATVLSTSNCGNPSLRQFGFGPVSGDGFGIGYIIKDEGISICVSSRHRQTKRFVETIESYLLEVRRMLRVVSALQGGQLGKPRGGVSRVREIEARLNGLTINGKNGVNGGVVTSAPGGAVGGNHAGSNSRAKFQRGRLITGLPSTGSLDKSGGCASPTEESLVFSEDDELGGYGFFDSGMLMHALRGRDEKNHHHHHHQQQEEWDRSAAAQARRRDVGRKLRLVDY